MLRGSKPKRMNVSSLQINGTTHRCDAAAERSLLSVLRDDLALRGRGRTGFDRRPIHGRPVGDRGGDVGQLLRFQCSLVAFGNTIADGLPQESRQRTLPPYSNRPVVFNVRMTVS